MNPMFVAVYQIICRVLQMTIGPHRPIRYLDSHQNVFPMDPRIHSPPQFNPPQLFSAANLRDVLRQSHV